jgi:hypothetical protein
MAHKFSFVVSVLVIDTTKQRAIAITVNPILPSAALDLATV